MNYEEPILGKIFYDNQEMKVVDEGEDKWRERWYNIYYYGDNKCLGEGKWISG